jgi:hypothetical protein
MVTNEAPSLFEGREEAARAYGQVIQALTALGPYTIEEKKTCLHACVHGSAFLGIHPRKAGLRLTVVLEHPVESPRIVKCEKASAKRFHVDLDLRAADGVDDELRAWLVESYGRKA